MTWPLNGSEAGGDWPCLIQISLLLLPKSSCSNAWIGAITRQEQRGLYHVKARSPPASLPFKGQVTEQTTVKVVYSLYRTRLQGIIVLVFIILDSIFVLMNTTTVRGQFADIRNHEKSQQLVVEWKSNNHGNHLSICIIVQRLVVRTTWSCK